MRAVVRLQDILRGKPQGVYPGPGPNAHFVESHAVLLVGYNLYEQYWLAKNSWGTSFADGGFFKVAFGQVGIGNPDDSYGLKFNLLIPTKPYMARVAPANKRPECYEYKCVPSDYVSKVAYMFQAPLQQLLSDNTAVVPQPDMWLGNRTLLVCGLDTGLSSTTAITGQLADVVDILLGIKNDVEGYNSTLALLSWDRRVLRTGVTAPYCRWHGVTCNNANEVTALNLSSCYLTGQMPRAELLAQLAHLQLLDVSRNALQGTLPAGYNALKVLQVLIACGNWLNGTLPPQWAKLQQLQVLRLGLPSNYDIDDCEASWLGGASIDSGDQKLNGTLPSAWASMQALREFSIGGHNLTGTLPSEYGNLTNLRILRLSDNHLTNELPVAWSAMASIMDIRLDRNNLDGSLPSTWGSMHWLGKLHLQGNQFVGILPVEWQNMLSMVDMNFGDDEEIIDKAGNSLTGTLPAVWDKMTRLVNLSMAYNRLVGPLPLRWTAFSRLEKLMLAGNMLTGTLPSQYSSLAHLRQLDVSNNSLTGGVPASWQALVDIQSLRLDNNKLTGTLPMQWSHMTRLHDLSLRNNHLRGTIPSSWSEMSSLQLAYLSGNVDLQGCLPNAWQGMSHGAMGVDLPDIDRVDPEANQRWNNTFAGPTKYCNGSPAGW